MARTSFLDKTKRDVVEFWVGHDKTLNGTDVTPSQILVAAMEKTPGFHSMPDVSRPNFWKGKGSVFGRVAAMFNHKRQGGFYLDLGLLMDIVFEWDRVPSPMHGENSIEYILASLKEQAIKRHSEWYEARHEETKHTFERCDAVDFSSFGR